MSQPSDGPSAAALNAHRAIRANRTRSATVGLGRGTVVLRLRAGETKPRVHRCACLVRDATAATPDARPRRCPGGPRARACRESGGRPSIAALPPPEARFCRLSSSDGSGVGSPLVEGEVAGLLLHEAQVGFACRENRHRLSTNATARQTRPPAMSCSAPSNGASRVSWSSSVTSPPVLTILPCTDSVRRRSARTRRLSVR